MPWIVGYDEYMCCHGFKFGRFSLKQLKILPHSVLIFLLLKKQNKLKYLFTLYTWFWHETSIKTIKIPWWTGRTSFCSPRGEPGSARQALVALLSPGWCQSTLCAITPCHRQAHPQLRNPGELSVSLGPSITTLYKYITFFNFYIMSDVFRVT